MCRLCILPSWFYVAASRKILPSMESQCYLKHPANLYLSVWLGIHNFCCHLLGK